MLPKQQAISQFELSKAITFSKFFSKVKLSPSAKLVLRCLIDHWNAEKMFCYPAQETITEETGLSLRSVKNAIGELREANLILTELKKSLNYTFTAKFFELVNFAPEQGRKCTLERAEFAPKQIKEKRKNNVFSFQKETGVSYKKFEPEKIETSSPLDFTFEQAEIYLKELPEILKHSYFAKELRKKFDLS